MVGDAPDLAIEHADVLGTLGWPDAQKLLDRECEGVLLVHRRDVVEPVEIGYGLEVGLVLDQLLGAPMKQADVRVGAFDHLAVHLKHQAEHAVRRGMLRTEVERQGLDLLGFCHQAPSSPVAFAFSSPGSWSMPSQGLMKSKLRYSCTSLTGS